MLALENELARYRQGKIVNLGTFVSLGAGKLTIRGEELALNTLRPLALTGFGRVEIRRIGADDPPLVLEPDEVDDPLLLVDLANTLIEEIPYFERRSVTGWPPGSVGDLSVRIGYDWRDLVVSGYSDKQIQGVLDGEYTVQELLRRKPKGRRR